MRGWFSEIVFLVTLVVTCVWSGAATLNNTYDRDVVGIIVLALAGYILATISLPFSEGEKTVPGDFRSYPRETSRLFKGLLLKSGQFAFVVAVSISCVAVLSVVVGATYAFSRGEGVYQGIVEFFRVLVWAAVAVPVYSLESVLLNHWRHLLRFIEYGSSCDSYPHWWDEKSAD